MGAWPSASCFRSRQRRNEGQVGQQHPRVSGEPHHHSWANCHPTRPPGARPCVPSSGAAINDMLQQLYEAWLGTILHLI